MKQTYSVYVGDSPHMGGLSWNDARLIAGDLWRMGEPLVSIEKED